jgi:hypothetical protein
MKTIADKRDEQRVLLEKVGGALDDASGALKRLWKLYDSEFGAEGEYVRDGAFTEAGRKRLRNLFEEGRRNMEIAAFFGVTDAAIAYHRKRWMQLEGSRALR